MRYLWIISGICSNGVKELLCATRKEMLTVLYTFCKMPLISFAGQHPQMVEKKIMSSIFHNINFLIDERHRLACTAAGKLGIVSTKVDYFLREYKAHISATPSKFVAGRGQVKCVQNFAAGVKYDLK